MTTGAGSTDPAEVKRVIFSREQVRALGQAGNRYQNWPVVYTLNNDRDVYVGESLSATGRLLQHLESPAKRHLSSARVIVDPTFNKSACLDLEAFLIRMFSGDGKFQVLNGNEGVVDHDYHDRADYQERFAAIFERLKAEGLFDKRIPEIENSDLFKLSPYKALNPDQTTVVEDVIEGLFAALATGQPSTAVVRGAAGTGKTIVAVYLLKLLADIRDNTDADNPDRESVLSHFFAAGNNRLLTGARIGFVVPQQSLRESIKRVFHKTPGLSKDMVLTPFDVGGGNRDWDILVVDEAHRLTQYAAQAMGTLTKQYREISEALAQPDEDWQTLTQIDWIRRRSKHQIFLLDAAQGVRTADIPVTKLAELAELPGLRTHQLSTQMRVRSGEDYVGYVRRVLSDDPPARPQTFADYDLRFFESAEDMYREIRQRDNEHGLARLVAGYAWKWRSRRGEASYDVSVEGLHLPWNRTDRDWINSVTSLDEVGSIHTVQGYDLNYAGVIIGPDLSYSPVERMLLLDRANYYDRKGKANNRLLGITYDDDQVLTLVRNVYAVLLTRGMLGTYVYVCDEALRHRLRPYFQNRAATAPGHP